VFRRPAVVWRAFVVVGAVVVVAAICIGLVVARSASEADEQRRLAHRGPAIALDALAELPATRPAFVPPYSRGFFGDWTDADHDCRDTRAEVLTTESRTPATGGCTIVTGDWVDAYTGRRVDRASALDVDHRVPLANAWVSGAWAWPAERRVQYANDLEDPEHLVAVSSVANRAKGDRSPDQWRPPDARTWCEYAVAWIGVKRRWGLSVTDAERGALGAMLASC
jgi:hypothetical protein